jgi:GDP/UDP-N,N'-diacetylbacillosamine 2-epimerase (hydrolysing)
LDRNEKRKICALIVDRANYGRLKPVMQAVHEHEDLELQVIASGTMVLERFGRAVDILRQDGFEISSEVYMELEGSTPSTMAKSVGLGVQEHANELARLKPDILLVIGDRYEALSAVIAAAYMNIPIAHVQGGEVSGSIDESARHAISKFAQFHFPSTTQSADYLVRMGERPETILAIGCPSSDIAKRMDTALSHEILHGLGSGAIIDLDKPYLLVVFHPTTTEFGDEVEQIEELLRALARVKEQTVMLWPNIDAGSDHISKSIRKFRTEEDRPWLRIITNLSPEDYLRVLANTACAVGNSSSFVRDAGYFGTPVVLAGHRQDGREHDVHLVRTETNAGEITEAIRNQMKHGRYPASQLFGDGDVAERICRGLVELTPYVQKRIAFSD